MAWITLATSACVLIAIASWLAFSDVISHPAYALDGIQERFLRSRSIHVKFSFYQTFTIDGEEIERSFPVEWYAERPSRYFIRGVGTEHDAKEIRTHTFLRGSDGEQGFFVSDKDKIAARTKNDVVSTELLVEYLLQNQFLQQIVSGPTSNYRLVGPEQLLGQKTLKYEWLDERKNSSTRNVIWMGSVTGLPIRSAHYEIDSKGRERPSTIYDLIEVNTPPPADMFPFKPPEGYRLVEAGMQPPDFGSESAGAGNDKTAARYALAIDRVAVLICWHHSTEGVEIENPDDDPVVPEAEFTRGGGSHTRSDADRKCEIHTIRTQKENGKLWRWSIAIPVDRRPLTPDDLFSLVFKFPSGSTSSFGNFPLHLDDERLKTVLARMQELGTPVGKIEPEMTLIRLRWLAARYLSGESDDDSKTNDKKSN